MSLVSAKIIIAISSILLIWGLFSPLGMVWLYLFIRPLLQPFSTLHYMLAGPIPLNGVFSISFILFSAIRVFFKRSASFFIGNAVILYILLFSMLLSLFFSIYPVGTVSAIIKIFTAASFYIVICNFVQNEFDVRKTLVAIMVSSIIPMLFGYYQFITGTGHAWKGDFYAGTRIDSVLGQYNEYGIYLATCFLCSLNYYLSTSSIRFRIISALIMSSQVVSIFLSKNRGTWIALGFALLITGTIFFRRVNKKIVIPIVVLIMLLTSSLIIERFQELYSVSGGGHESNTLVGRIELWKSILPYALEKPFTGWGLGSAPIFMEKTFGRALFPHNDYLLLLFEAGFPTLIVFIFYMFVESVYFVRKAVTGSCWPADFTAITLLIYYSIISFTQNIIFNQVLFPLVLGSFALMRRYSILLDEENKQTEL